MPKSKSANDLAWQAKKRYGIKQEYAEYRSSKGLDNDSTTASAFAISKIAGGVKYMGMTEREIVLLLVGSLPDNFD